MDSVTVQKHDTVAASRWVTWAGWIVSLAPLAIVGMSARWKLTHDPWYVREFARIGWSAAALPWLAGIQLTAVALFLLPPTAVLGAVLLTGYLGGAIASYVRIGELYPPVVPLGTALLAWLGIYLRESRLWYLLPLVRKPPMA